jgi:hypothetical protein
MHANSVLEGWSPWILICCTSFLMIAGYFGQQFLVAMYLQRVLSFSAAEVGLGMLPIAAAIAATSLGLAARLIVLAARLIVPAARRWLDRRKESPRSHS